MKAISFHKNITDAGLAHLAGGCGGLTSVDLFECVNITDAGLAHLAGGCRGLTSVDLFGCDKLKVTFKGSFALGQGCPRFDIENLIMPS